MIYLDNAATTKVSAEVLSAMTPYLTEQYGNASSIYRLGRESAIALENARSSAARSLGCDPKEVFFTAGGSESDNWAIKSVAEAAFKKGKKRIISSAFEHHAVLHVLETLGKKGFEIVLLPVYGDGLVRPADLESAIAESADGVALVTIMYANNEIGTIQPIAEFGEICQKHRIPFHTDAVQAIGNVDVDVKAQNIDLLSLSGHKIHGAKGVGLLYCAKKIRLAPFIEGGAQERGFRAGTENVAGIVGLSVALENAVAGVAAKKARLLPLRQKLIDNILKIERTRLNGSLDRRLCSNVNISIECIEGESLLLQLDLKGVCASSGSACTSGSLDPSHVLLALGLPHEIAHGSLRLSMSEHTTEEEIDQVLEVLPPIVEKLRAMSPMWK